MIGRPTAGPAVRRARGVERADERSPTRCGRRRRPDTDRGCDREVAVALGELSTGAPLRDPHVGNDTPTRSCRVRCWCSTCRRRSRAGTVRRPRRIYLHLAPNVSATPGTRPRVQAAHRSAERAPGSDPEVTDEGRRPRVGTLTHSVLASTRACVPAPIQRRCGNRCPPQWRGMSTRLKAESSASIGTRLCPPASTFALRRSRLHRVRDCLRCVVLERSRFQRPSTDVTRAWRPSRRRPGRSRRTRTKRGPTRGTRRLPRLPRVDRRAPARPSRGCRGCFRRRRSSRCR